MEDPANYVVRPDDSYQELEGNPGRMLRWGIALSLCLWAIVAAAIRWLS